MALTKEDKLTILLVVLGAIAIPVILIWSADGIFILTLKAWVAAFFLLLIVRYVLRKRDRAPVQEDSQEGE